MEEQIIYDRKSFYIVLMLTLAILLLGHLIQGSIALLLGMFSWAFIYFINKGEYNHEFSILRLLILSIPLSFTNVFGQSYGESIVSWFNIFLLIIGITYVFKYFTHNRIYLNYFSLASIWIILISVVPVMYADNSIYGLKQYINTMTLFSLVIIGNAFKDNLTNTQNDILKIDYIMGTIIACIGTIIQIWLLKKLNITVGNYQFLGGYRQAFGFLFRDYSFLSLYLASGAMLIYFLENKYEKFYGKKMSYIGILLYTSILTSARTGIISFVVIFGFFSVIYLLKLIKAGSIKSILIIMANITIIIIGYFLTNKTRSTGAFSDSGRMQLNAKAFDIFLSNPFLGIGFGSENYMGMLPHNILFQSIAQGGLLYTVPLMVFILIMLWEAYKHSKEVFPVLLCILFGALFIPNIFNSRFLPALALLVSISI